MYKTLLSQLDEHQQKTLWQLIRYVFSGGVLTVLHLGIYWTAAQRLAKWHDALGNTS